MFKVGSENEECKSKLSNDEDEDIEDEDLEPKLKYELLSSDLKRILNCDSVSALGVHSKFLVMGSHWGSIHMFDANGNCLPNRESAPHSLSVNAVSIDHTGEFVASSSPDGTIRIQGLLSAENNHNFLLDGDVKRYIYYFTK